MVYRCTREPEAAPGKAATPIERLRDTIKKAERLGTKGKTPESFYLQKEEIITDLRALERDMVQAR